MNEAWRLQVQMGLSLQKARVPVPLSLMEMAERQGDRRASGSSSQAAPAAVE